MLEKLSKNENYVYEKLTEDEMKSRGILGRLVGNVADFINPTRNGRKYNEDLWDRVFDNPIMKEKFKNKVMYGELGHPADRTEIDMEKIAVCMAEQPKKDKDGKLKAVFDILPTPNGKILKALCDYGSTLGISSRGTGDIIEDEDGNEIVDPDTYDCECWDIVLVPAVESARLQYVTESLNNDKLNLKKALCESLNSASESERKVMTETLKELNIKVEDDTNESIPEKDGDKLTESKSSEQTIDKTEEANNDGSDEVIKSLQEALKANVKLEAEIKTLQEAAAVSDAKVTELTEELGKYKNTTIRLSKESSEAKSLEERVSTLEEELKKKEQTIEFQNKRISSLVESSKAETTTSKSLNESISNKDKEIATLNESLKKAMAESEAKIAELNESIKTLKADSESQDKEYCKKLTRETKLKEGYKKLANSTMTRYIESKALMLDVTVNEIKNKLPESYSIEDVDAVCEDLQSYALNISKLPFSIDRKVNVKVRESKNESLRINEVEDDVDEDLLRLAGLK